MAHVDATSRAFGRRAAQGSSGAQALHVARTLLFSASLAAVLVGCAQNKCPAGSELRAGLCKPKSKQGASAAADAAVDAGAAGAHVASGADKDAGYDAGPTHATDAGHTAYAADSGTANTTCDHAYVLVRNACVRDYCVQLSGEDSPCPANATCSAGTTLNKVCTCNTGYVQSGNACVRDHCVMLQGEAPACQANATCGNGTAATPTCICDAGYDLTSGVCNRNACELLTGAPDPAACGANQTCTPTTPGQKQCSCVAGYADCDGNASNGCEVTPASDANNCGKCAYACAGGLSCTSGVCADRVKLMAVGYYGTCAIRPTGSVLGWGAPPALFPADSKPITQPTILDRPAAAQISVGINHTCLVAQGTLSIVCWGQNGYLQLGSGVSTDTTQTLSVPAGVRAIGAGNEASCAVISSSGDVVCWGDGSGALMGDGVARPSGASNQAFNVTDPVHGVGGAVDVGVGYDMACALTAAGGVLCWGHDPKSSTYYTPEPVKGNDNSDLTDVAAITVGYQHACALRSNHQVVCWGDNAKGQLGLNQTPVARNRYLAVPLPSGALGLAAGGTHTCAVVQGGTVYCWGDNGYGQLGSGSLTQTSSSTPLLIPSFSDVVAVYSGSTAVHSCARKHDGNVYCWGFNYYGELGGAQTGSVFSVPQLIPTSLWP